MQYEQTTSFLAPNLFKSYCWGTIIPLPSTSYFTLCPKGFARSEYILFFKALEVDDFIEYISVEIIVNSLRHTEMVKTNT